MVIEGNELSTHVLNEARPNYTCVIPFSEYLCDIVSEKLGLTDRVSGDIKKMSWLASMNATEFGLEAAPNAAAACCGGQGCCLTTIKGSGTSFLNVGGTVIQKKLQVGESIIVDTNSLVAWSRTTKFDVQLAGNMTTVCCGGMGLYNTKVTGPGLVIIQSMPFEKAASAYMEALAGKNAGVELEDAIL